eukprot:3615528-Prymnesium_polylepis.2
MCRKLSICGWVLLIQDEAEQARIVMALLVSFLFLVLRLVLKPLKRCVASEPRTSAMPETSCTAICANYVQPDAHRVPVQGRGHGARGISRDGVGPRISVYACDQDV